MADLKEPTMKPAAEAGATDQREEATGRRAGKEPMLQEKKETFNLMIGPREISGAFFCSFMPLNWLIY
jgi:hypothetical protein